MFDLLKVLPQAFQTWKAIEACIKGGATPTELRTAVTEFTELLETIPPLRGVLAIFQTVVSVVEKFIPGLLDDPDKMQELGLDPDVVQQAASVATLYNEVMKKAGQTDGLKQDMLGYSADDVNGMV
ncbi:MAG: hypothetical protein IPK54_10105 [Dokdonella sp.]|uniref:hypothetical protein n=1 Tax=Dokdonella sp. TaxID=2291710 RepID=UPI0025C4F523|nr:hypothetical protein [Dokdonella sp.]MBK8123884.1 hypothetical protein [Dokdonella sp.]